MGKSWESDDQASNFWVTHFWTKPRRILVVWVALEALACTGDIQVLWLQQRSPKRETAFTSLNVIFCPMSTMSTTTYPLQLQKTWRRAVLTQLLAELKTGACTGHLSQNFYTSHSTLNNKHSWSTGGDCWLCLYMFIYIYMFISTWEGRDEKHCFPLTWNVNEKFPSVLVLSLRAVAIYGRPAIMNIYSATTSLW